MRNRPLAIVLALGLALAPAWLPAPAAAQEREESPEQLMREGMERMLRAMELLIEMVPQYEAPELTPEGDIIIRRKRRVEEPLEPETLEEDT